MKGLKTSRTATIIILMINAIIIELVVIKIDYVYALWVGPTSAACYVGEEYIEAGKNATFTTANIDAGYFQTKWNLSTLQGGPAPFTSKTVTSTFSQNFPNWGKYKWQGIILDDKWDNDIDDDAATPYADNGTLTVIKVKITGPNEVYYFASGSPTITLNSEINPAGLGGTYQWTTTSNKITFIGSTTNPSVVLKGSAKSTPPNGKEEIKLKYTVGGTIIIATHKVKIRKPTKIEHPDPVNHLYQITVVVTLASDGPVILTLYDQFDQTMKNVPITETRSINSNLTNVTTIGSFGNPPTIYTNSSGQIGDAWIINVFYPFSGNDRVVVDQNLYAGGFHVKSIRVTFAPSGISVLKTFGP